MCGTAALGGVLGFQKFRGAKEFRSLRSKNRRLWSAAAPGCRPRLRNYAELYDCQLLPQPNKHSVQCTLNSFGRKLYPRSTGNFCRCKPAAIIQPENQAVPSGCRPCHHPLQADRHFCKQHPFLYEPETWPAYSCRMSLGCFWIASVAFHPLLLFSEMINSKIPCNRPDVAKKGEVVCNDQLSEP
jgi:hypothetical protein